MINSESFDINLNRVNDRKKMESSERELELDNDGNSF